MKLLSGTWDVRVSSEWLEARSLLGQAPGLRRFRRRARPHTSHKDYRDYRPWRQHLLRPRERYRLQELGVL